MCLVLPVCMNHTTIHLQCFCGLWQWLCQKSLSPTILCLFLDVSVQVTFCWYIYLMCGRFLSCSVSGCCSKINSCFNYNHQWVAMFLATIFLLSLGHDYNKRVTELAILTNSHISPVINLTWFLGAGQ